MIKVFKYKCFIEELNKLDLTIKEFSQLSETSYNTVMSWSNNKKLPNWVKTWLKLYNSKIEHQQLIKKVKGVKNAISTLREL